MKELIMRKKRKMLHVSEEFLRTLSLLEEM
jgi:hypothetical protein